MRKLFRLIVLVTSTGKYHQSRNKTKFWTKMKIATHAFENVFTVPGSLLLLPFLPGVGLLLLLYLLAATNPVTRVSDMSGGRVDLIL